jgi:UDP-glucose 4-epimerase
MIDNSLSSRFTGARALITGGLGMLGSCIAHQLVKSGCSVTVADACIEPYGAKMFNLDGIRDNVELSITDIRDREAMKTLVQGQDFIFNLAGQVSHNDSLRDPFLDADINYIGHLNVVECVRKHSPKAKILYSGSRLQYGVINSLPVTEDHKLTPKTPYAFNKTVAENMYRYYYEQYGIRCVMFRIANPYGIRSQMKHARYSIVNYFIRLAMEDQPIRIYGDGKQLRDYVYVDDLVNAFMLAATTPEADGEVFNLGSGTGTPFKQMVTTIVDAVGKGHIQHVPWPENYVNIETGDYYLDIDKIKNTLDWEPQVSLPDGIQKTFEYYKAHQQHYF